MSRTFLLVAAAVVVLPGMTQAQAPRYIQVTGVVGGSQLNVKAVNLGGNYAGLGTLTAPTGQVYNLKVMSGQVQLDRYVSLQGAILGPNGQPVTSFTLNADRISGGIVFTYTGAGGTLVRQTTTGTVLFMQ